MCTALPLLAALLFARTEDPKPEPPAAVKDVLDRYLKAAEANDSRAMADLADVPWLDRDRQVVRNRAGLRRALAAAAKQLRGGEGACKVESLPYRKIRDALPDKAARTRLDEVLGDDGWMVSVERDGYPLSDRIILIRLKGGKAAVVGCRTAIEMSACWPQ